VPLNKVLMCDIAREFCNQVGGRVQRIFKRYGIEFEMFLPQVFCGGGQMSTLPTENSTVSIHYSIAKNIPCVIEFSLTDIDPALIRAEPDHSNDEEVTFF